MRGEGIQYSVCENTDSQKDDILPTVSVLKIKGDQRYHCYEGLVNKVTDCRAKGVAPYILWIMMYNVFILHHISIIQGVCPGDKDNSTQP